MALGLNNIGKAHFLEGKTEILILPAGILGLLPFETLLSGENGYPEESMVSDKEIAYTAIQGGSRISDIYERMGLQWTNLPGTVEEVRGIGSLFPNSVIITGYDVNVKTVRDLSSQGKLSDYIIIHFATHGLVVPEFPELSALVLSKTEDNDGYLCMDEITALDIEAEFVNLSACETGLGKIYAGEGIVGLTQSFLIAGAKGVTVSLWQVADESTKDFMLGMYQLVTEKGLGYADALRQMKLAFLQGKYSNPFYWAPFVYYGQ